MLSQLASPIIGDPTFLACGRYFSRWRSYQDFHTDSTASVRGATVSRSERDLDSDGQNLVNVLHTLYTTHRDFKQSVDDAMNAAFPDHYEELVFPPDAGDQRIQMMVRWKRLKRPTSTADLSDGTLRFLFLLAILANPFPPSLIAIDEPEAGLHPRMMSIVAELASEMASKVQVVFTTHSAEFLDVLTEFRPTTSIVELCDGETRINTLSADRLGYWLRDYTLGELYRTRGLETLL